MCSPLDEGAKKQPDGFLNVLSAQPAPLVLHQQTQDVQSNICHSCVCSQTNTPSDTHDTVDRSLLHSHTNILTNCGVLLQPSGDSASLHAVPVGQ